MVLGRRIGFPYNGMEPPVKALDPAPPYIFNRPTDVAFDAAGNIFVADGYVNSRVVKYDKNGRFIKQVGHRGSGPGEFTLLHSLVVDAKGDVYGGSRSDERIVVFDNDLNYKTTYDHVGAPWSLCITSGPHQYLYTSNSNPDIQRLRDTQGHRPGLQDGAGRHRPWQVRCPRQRAGTVQHRARNRLPQRKRNSRHRNRRMAPAEIHPAPHRRSRGQEMTYSRFAAMLLVRRLASRRLAVSRSSARLSFESAGDFLSLPADTHFGEVAGVATTSKGTLLVYYQSGGPNSTIGASRVYINGGPRLFEFDRSGKFQREIGSSTRTAAPTPSCLRRASGSIPRTTSGSWTAPPGWSSSSTPPAASS